MKKIVSLLAVLFLIANISAQSIPQEINYQAVARNADGELLKNETINVTIEVFVDNTTSTAVYEEIHNNVPTNDYGLFYFKIGTGSVLSGSFNTINWGASQHYLNTIIDGESLGRVPLVSVPYALAALNAQQIQGVNVDTTGIQANNILVFNGTNWQVQSNSGTPGSSSLIVTSVENPGANCSTGGIHIQSGVDANNSGVLEASEIVGNDYVCNGLNGTSINWLGVFGNPPLTPSPNDAYHNTIDGNSYIYNGISWDVLASVGATGQTGVAGSSITWQGDFSTAPTTPTPVTNDAYHNTTDGNSYIYDGTNWGVLASSGATGVAGSSITWQGDLSTAPTTPTPVTNDAYHNTTDGNSYIYDGTNWVVLASSGAINNLYTQDGTLTGNRIVTQGANTLSFSTTAVNGFSVDGATFSVDGANNKVGIGTIAPTGYLTINHAANTASNPIPNPALKIHSSNSGYNRIQFDNSTSSKFWEIAAATNGTDANAGWSVNYYDGATYKNNIITYGDQKTAIIGDSLPNAWGFNSSDFDVFGSTTLHDSLTINTPYGTAYTLPIGDGAANAVIQTDGNGLLSWVDPATFSGTSTAWNLTGNTGTAATDFIGTTDAQNLHFKTNNIEALVIDQSQSVGIGLQSTGINTAAKLHVASESNQGIAMQVSSSTIGNHPSFSLVRSGGTLTSKTQVNAGDKLGTLEFLGYNSAEGTFKESGSISVVATEDANSVSKNGGRMHFKVHANGGLSSNTAMTIDHNGNIGIGINSPQALLDVSGTGGIIITRESTAPTGVNGMIYYNTAINKFQVYENGAWVDWVSGGASNTAWNLTGNTGTIPGTTAGQNFIGTTDAQDLVLATNGTEAMRINTSQMIGIRGTPNTSSAMKIYGDGSGSLTSDDADLFLSGGNQEISLSTNSDPLLILTNLNGALNNKNYIEMNNTASGVVKNTAQISSFLSATNEGNLEFSTLNGASPTDKMLISKDGVTIGNGGLTAPTSTLSVVGSEAKEITIHTASAGLTLDETHSVIIANVTGVTPLPIVLPSASTCKGRVYTIIKKDGANSIAVNTASGDYFDDAIPYAQEILIAKDVITLISDGANTWYIINKY